MLDRVATSAGYQHWHHVSPCLKQTEAKSGVEALHADCEIVLRAAREGIDKVIVTNAGELPAPLVMFASQQDAWLLDPDENLTLLEELRQWIDKAQSFNKRFDTLIARDDAVDLTADIVARLIAEGWEANMIEQGHRDGAGTARAATARCTRRCFGSSDDDEETRHRPGMQSAVSTPPAGGSSPSGQARRRS